MLFEAPFYFLRHLETDAHCNKILCGGRMDLPLNENGLAQTRQFATFHGKDLQRIQTICTSPLLRAKQTAEALQAVAPVPVVVVEELREWDLGEWEGKPTASVPSPFGLNQDPPGGETCETFLRRVRAGLFKAFRYESPVLIVAHGGVSAAVQKLLGVEVIPVSRGVLYEISSPEEFGASSTMKPV